MKFDKLTEAYMNVITEKLKTFEVYLDRPGAGWAAEQILEQF